MRRRTARSTGCRRASRIAPTATPRPSSRARAAAAFPIDQPGKYALMRFSTGHAGIHCQGCHSSSHGLEPVTPDVDTGTYAQAAVPQPRRHARAGEVRRLPPGERRRRAAVAERAELPRPAARKRLRPRGRVRPHIAVKTRSHTLLALAALALGAGCAQRRPPAPPPPPAPVETAQTFADIPVQKLRADPDAYVGTVFDETFVFSRVWWGRDRKRPGKPALDIPTHFTARVTASPVHMARIEFPPEADPLFEDMRAGTRCACASVSCACSRPAIRRSSPSRRCFRTGRRGPISSI